mmetsp:Transcript_99972/g.278413  ORF Transcript_99972/g.278413 Transcript_99972/m.278413 type:complete len:258 (+) Transcript_99972:141-914(+)
MALYPAHRQRSGRLWWRIWWRWERLERSPRLERFGVRTWRQVHRHEAPLHGGRLLPCGQGRCPGGRGGPPLTGPRRRRVLAAQARPGLQGPAKALGGSGPGHDPGCQLLESRRHVLDGWQGGRSRRTMRSRASGPLLEVLQDIWLLRQVHGGSRQRAGSGRRGRGEQAAGSEGVDGGCRGACVSGQDSCDRPRQRLPGAHGMAHPQGPHSGGGARWTQARAPHGQSRILGRHLHSRGVRPQPVCGIELAGQNPEVHR